MITSLGARPSGPTHIIDAHLLCLLKNLLSQLSCRGQKQPCGVPALGVLTQVNQDREEERSRLPGSSLGTAHDVPLGQHAGDGPPGRCTNGQNRGRDRVRTHGLGAIKCSLATTNI